MWHEKSTKSKFHRKDDEILNSWKKWNMPSYSNQKGGKKKCVAKEENYSWRIQKMLIQSHA